MKLFTNARFFSMEKPEDSYSALLESEGRILKLYRRDEQIPSGLGAHWVDLGGADVYPGFVDTHTHAFAGGLLALCTDLGGCTDLGEVLEALAAADTQGGLLFSWNLDIHKIREGRFPTLKELDRLYPAVPVLVRRADGHSCMINSAALARIPWKEGFPPAEFPLVSGRNRQATAWFNSSVDDDGILKAYGAASDIALKNGLTGFHTMIGDAEKDTLHYTLLRDNLDRFDADILPYPQIRNIPRAVELGSPMVGGCLLADGSIGSHTAALHSPYSDMPETRGELYHESEHWYGFYRAAHKAGLQGCVHAIGEAAVDQLAGVLRRLYDEEPKNLIHQIIHCEMVTDEALSLLEGLPVAAVVQPAFDALWGGVGGLYEKHLGVPRLFECNRYASLSRAGVLLTGGSDWHITPLDPLFGIRSAVNLSCKDEGLSLFEAISMYSVNAAKLSGKDDRSGYLRPGYLCDMSVVSGPMEDPDSRVLGVIKSGRFIPST